MAPGFKTGGRTKGTPNKPRPIILASTEQNRELLAVAAVMKTPKMLMLEAMLRFESIGLSLLAKAERLAQTKASASQIAMLATEGHKFLASAVQCAEKVAPSMRGCSRWNREAPRRTRRHLLCGCRR